MQAYLEKKQEKRLTNALILLVAMGAASGITFLIIKQPWLPSETSADEEKKNSTRPTTTTQPNPSAPVGTPAPTPSTWEGVVAFFRNYWFILLLSLILLTILIIVGIKVSKVFRDIYRAFGGGFGGAAGAAGLLMTAVGALTGNPVLAAAGIVTTVSGVAMVAVNALLGKLTSFERIHEYETVWSNYYNDLDDNLEADVKQKMEDIHAKLTDPNATAEERDLAARRYYNFVKAVQSKSLASPLSRFFLTNSWTGYGDPEAALDSEKPTVGMFFRSEKLIEQRNNLLAAIHELNLPVAPTKALTNMTFDEIKAEFEALTNRGSSTLKEVQQEYYSQKKENKKNRVAVEN